jgi:Domain of unknown function (DUF397)
MSNHHQLAWHKSSHSVGNGACVEVAWRKSSGSVANGACVEVGTMACGGDVLVRDTKDREGPVLRFTPTEWSAFLAGARAGEFDHLATAWPLVKRDQPR